MSDPLLSLLVGIFAGLVVGLGLGALLFRRRRRVTIDLDNLADLLQLERVAEILRRRGML